VTVACTTSTPSAGSPAARSPRSSRPEGENWIADLGDVDTAATILTLDDGSLAVVSNTRYNSRGYDVRLELHGSLDSIAAGLNDGLPLGSAEPGVTFPAGPPYTFFMDRFAAAFRAELAAFTEVVNGLRPSPCTVADAVESGWVAEAATLSLREHRPVRVDEVRGPARLPQDQKLRAHFHNGIGTPAPTTPLVPAGPERTAQTDPPIVVGRGPWAVGRGPWAVGRGPLVAVGWSVCGGLQSAGLQSAGGFAVRRCAHPARGGGGRLFDR
jgi:hypothetical protein